MNDFQNQILDLPKTSLMADADPNFQFISILSKMSRICFCFDRNPSHLLWSHGVSLLSVTCLNLQNVKVHPKMKM